jgi:5'-nucleotidase
MRLGGKPLEPKRNYRVTVNSFLAAGGDKFEILRDGVDRREGPLDVDALTAYLGKVSSSAKPLEPAVVGGRIGGDVCR